MTVPAKRDAASDDEEDFHSGRDSGGDDKSVFSDSDDDADVVLQSPGAPPAVGEQAKGQQRSNEHPKLSTWSSKADPAAPSRWQHEHLALLSQPAGCSTLWH